MFAVYRIRSAPFYILDEVEAALDDSNYLEFMEIRNAIEQLGGVVDDTYRDFTDDPYYKAIKHLK